MNVWSAKYKSIILRLRVAEYPSFEVIYKQDVQFIYNRSAAYKLLSFSETDISKVLSPQNV